MSKRSNLEVRNKAIELYKEGLSANKVAKQLGFNEATVRKWLKDNGVYMRIGGFYNKKYSKEIETKVKELYEQGKYTTEIDDILNLKRGVAQYILNKNQIKMRHRGPKSMIEKEDFFDNIDNEQKAYFLGYIMADGNVSITNGQYSLKFHISIQDKEVINNFIKAINSSNKVSIRENTKSYYVSLTSIHMCKSLINLGVIPNKTSKEIIPEQIPKELLNHYIRGVFDGDGITDISKKRSGFVGSNNLISQILKELNEDLTIFPAGKNKKVFYFLGGKKFSKKLYEYLYKDSTIWLERKRKRLKYICS